MITKMEDIINKFEEEVSITGFEEGEFITLKLRRVRLLELVSKGTIPNQLMITASKVFGVSQESSLKKSKSDIDQEAEAEIDYKELNDLLDLICENVILEPSYDELKKYLTDQQKMEIFYYSQGGLMKVEKFREQQRIVERAFYSRNLQEATK